MLILTVLEKLADLETFGIFDSDAMSFRMYRPTCWY